MNSELVLKLKTKIGHALISRAKKVDRNKDTSFFGKIQYSSFSCLLRIMNMSLYPIKNTHKYKELYDCVNIKTIRPRRMGFTTNVITRINEEERVINIPLSEMTLANFNDVVIMGESDIVVDTKHHVAINDMCYNLDARISFFDNFVIYLKY